MVYLVTGVANWVMGLWQVVGYGEGGEGRRGMGMMELWTVDRGKRQRCKTSSFGGGQESERKKERKLCTWKILL